jgi:hypothetical protein
MRMAISYSAVQNARTWMNRATEGDSLECQLNTRGSLILIHGWLSDAISQLALRGNST